MTTAATRIREIAELEGFEVEILDSSGNLINPAMQGLPSYSRTFEKKAKSSWTVAEWVENRFAKVFPGYRVKVLFDDGKVASGNTKLQTVRESYETK
jgi:hypothetical protein